MAPECNPDVGPPRIPFNDSSSHEGRIYEVWSLGSVLAVGARSSVCKQVATLEKEMPSICPQFPYGVI